jgi:hypothetical protein
MPGSLDLKKFEGIIRLNFEIRANDALFCDVFF